MMRSTNWCVLAVVGALISCADTHTRPTDLKDACPTGSLPVVAENIEAACGGKLGIGLKDEEGALAAQCVKNGPRIVVCREVNWCTDGTQVITPTRIACECAKPVTYKSCRHPDFGQEGWNRSENYDSASAWIDGGRDEVWWCNEAKNHFVAVRGIGPSHAVKTTSSWQESNKDWKGHVTYKYHCSINVSWDPRYNERTDPRCGVVQ